MGAVKEWLPPAGAALSERELRILELVSYGKENAVIGRLLHLSEDTVKTYVRRLVTKLGARNRTHAVRLGFELGYLEIDVRSDHG